MTRNRLAAVLLPILAMTAAGAHAGTQTVNLGPTELGQITTACFLVCFEADCSGSGTISSLAVDPPFFVRGVRVAAAADEPNLCNNTSGLSTPANLPVNLDSNQILVFDVDVVPTQLGMFTSPLSINGSDPPDFELTTDVEPLSGCAPSATAHCLAADRFKVRTHWRTPFGTRGAAQVVQGQGASTDDSGLFYFFDEDNFEVLLKVLDACTLPPPRFWVFSAATTNVEYTITVVDTEAQPEQVAQSYFKPQGPPAPAITDTDAFATCP